MNKLGTSPDKIEQILLLDGWHEVDFVAVDEEHGLITFHERETDDAGMWWYAYALYVHASALLAIREKFET